MYQVLLVTDQRDIRDVFEAFPDWADLGFDRPRVIAAVEEAMRFIDSDTVDAVAYVLPKEEGQSFFSFLARHPRVRCMEAASDTQRLRRALGTLRRALHEAGSVDVHTDVLPILQAEFFHSLIDGAPLDREALRARTAALRMQISLDAPVCVASLQLPQGEAYLEDVWRYGRERLEVALRNFFERDLAELRYVLDVLSPSDIRLLACPKEALDAEEMRRRTDAHLAEALESVQEYLDLEIQVRCVRLYEDLPALCARRAAPPAEALR